MDSLSEKTLLAGVLPNRFVGRLAQLERLYLHAVSGSEPYCVRVSGSPHAGTSELLRQVYDRLFREQRFVVPFYFALRSGDETGHAAAARYAYEFLLQAIAFRRKDPSLLFASPDICELAKLAPPSDADWVDKMCEVCRNDGPLNDGRAFIRSALAAPLRAAARAKMRVAVIVDDLHESAALDGGRTFIDELVSVSTNARSPFILAARRRFVMPGFRRDIAQIGPLPRKEAAELVELLASDIGVAITEQTRDLIAVQFGGNPTLIRSFVYGAAESRLRLASYRDIEQLYTRELIGGQIGNYFEGLFARAAPDLDVRGKLAEMLHRAVDPEGQRFALGPLRERLGLTSEDFDRLAESLHLDEVVTVENGTARLSSDNLLRDFLEARFRLNEERASTAAASASAITESLKRAPRLMARIYRREASVGLVELTLMFDIQDVPRALLDYRIFRDRYKGIADGEIRIQLTAEKDAVTLPQISHASPIVEHFPGFGEPVEPERAIAAVGFTDRTYRDEDQIAWLAVEIDSKLEADHSLTQEWCDRLDHAAAVCGFSNYRIWLIAPEGFSDGALDLLSDRNAYGSSRRQVDLLRAFLAGEDKAEVSEMAEYEMVIPAGEDTELIAAHALEEISRRYSFPAKAVNQIKTALVEACINAAEHGLSPDRKIYQKFAVDDEKIVITISNRGLRLTDKQPATEIEPTEGRRGWGLNLIRGLMDEVRIEAVDDGTRIVMTKFLKAR